MKNEYGFTEEDMEVIKKYMALEIRINNELYCKRGVSIKDGNPGISSHEAYELAFKSTTFELLAEIMVKLNMEPIEFKRINP